MTEEQGNSFAREFYWRVNFDRNGGCDVWRVDFNNWGVKWSRHHEVGVDIGTAGEPFSGETVLYPWHRVQSVERIRATST